MKLFKNSLAFACLFSCAHSSLYTSDDALVTLHINVNETHAYSPLSKKDAHDSAQNSFGLTENDQEDTTKKRLSQVFGKDFSDEDGVSEETNISCPTDNISNFLARCCLCFGKK